MRILFVILVLMITGCATNTVYVKVPVWTPPVLDKPVRPVMRDNTNITQEGLIVRNVELNTLDLMQYAEELEKILEVIK